MTSKTQHHVGLDQSERGTELGAGGTNKMLLLAAALAAFTAVLHIFGGGASVAEPIAASALADEPRLLALAVWHMVSITLVLSALGLGLGALPQHTERSRYLVLFISALWIGFGLAVIGVILTEQGDNLFRTLPQPILLVPIGLLGLRATLSRSGHGELCRDCPRGVADLGEPRVRRRHSSHGE